jgi:indolepyruvate ferredoxin oxidoreductase beta subunit
LAEVKKQKNYVALDADKIASEIGSKRSSNIVMLGAATPFFEISFESFEEGIRQIFARKGDDIINMNLKALRAGREFTEKNR